MIKTFFKLLPAAIIYTIVFIAANAVLPFSRAFRELGASGGPLSLLLLFASGAYTCFTMFFIIKNSRYSGIKLFAVVLFVMFFVQYFMTQIETLLFNDSFSVLTRLDVVLIMTAGLIPLLVTAPLLGKFFQNKNAVGGGYKSSIKNIALKLAVIGILYLCIYMVFGYFVAWQFGELRLFYSGTTEKLGFWGQMANNIQTKPLIFPFQAGRGILFALAVLPLRYMAAKGKTFFITSVCLLYLCTAVVLIIPNALFPDTVRFAHLIEMSSSMLLFGIITGSILWGTKQPRQART